MKNQKGFLQLTAATVFGLVAIAASIIGIGVGTWAVKSPVSPFYSKATADVYPEAPTGFQDYGTTPGWGNPWITTTARQCNPDNYSFDVKICRDAPERNGFIIEFYPLPFVAPNYRDWYEDNFDSSLPLSWSGDNSVSFLPYEFGKPENDCATISLEVLMKAGDTGFCQPNQKAVAFILRGVNYTGGRKNQIIIFGTPPGDLEPTATPIPDQATLTMDADCDQVSAEITNDTTEEVTVTTLWRALRNEEEINSLLIETQLGAGTSKNILENWPNGSLSENNLRISLIGSHKETHEKILNCAPTPTSCQKPAAPSDLDVSQLCPPTIPTGQVALLYEWEDNSTDENGFRLYYGTGSAGVDVQIDGDFSPNTTDYTETTIPTSTCQQRAMYSVASFNECGESGRGFVTAPATNCCVASPPTSTPIPTPTDGDCSGCVGGTQKKYSQSVWDIDPADPNNGIIDNCQEACRAYFGPECTQSGCGNSGSTDPGSCCWCKTANDVSCDALPTPTPVPGIDCREENCQAIPWGGGTAWLNKIVYSIPDVPNYYSDSACTQSIDPYSYCTAVGGGGVPYFNTDLDNNNTTNSLDWAILVTGWTKGKYNALDASLFLWNWAGQN